MKNDPIMQYLVATVDKRLLVKTLREWRREAEYQAEADVLDDVIDAVLSGEFDG